jgi:hypothetical protein
MLTFNTELRSAAAGLGVAFLVGGCAMMGLKAERYVPPPLGTTWERMQTDTGSYGSSSAKSIGRRGERTWQGGKVITFQLANGTVHAQQDGAWLGIFKGDTPIFTFDPPLNWQYPLEVGKTWSREQRMTIHAAKRTIAYQLTQKVEAIEDVSVPAGTFKTFKVSTKTSLGDENVVWFSPELGIFVKVRNERTAKHPQGPGTQSIDLLSYKRGG